MIPSLEVDVAALQQLPETAPVEPSFVDGGLCNFLSVQMITGTLVPCMGHTRTCGRTQGSPPKE